MSESIQFKESVRGIVEYVLKGGSLDDRFVSRGRALEGTIAHGKLQRDNEKVYQDYEKEVILKHEFLIYKCKSAVELNELIKESIEYETTHRGIHVRAFPADFLHD